MIFVRPDNLSHSEETLVSSLVDKNMINKIEEATRDQTLSEQWKKECKFRFTASKFDLISKRRRKHDKFAMDLINPKAFTLRYVEHGIKYELIALQEHEKIMFARKARVKVLEWFCCLPGYAFCGVLTRWQGC